MNELLQTNLKQLAIYQEQAYVALNETSLESQRIDSEQWIEALYPLMSQKPIAIFILGLSSAAILQAFMDSLPPDVPVLILEPSPSMAQFRMSQDDFSGFIQDPRITFLIAEPDALHDQWRIYQVQLQDHLGIAYYQTHPQHTFYQELALYQDFQKKAQQATQNPLSRLPALQEIYAQLQPLMDRAYQTYDLTCKQGCADCCQSSVGFHLCINPLEWALMHQTLMALPKSERQSIFDKAVQTLAQHQDFLVELLYYFDTQPERQKEPEFHFELSMMAGDQRASDCVFLSDAEACQIYTGRPLTSRVFGNSHVQGIQAFTCEIDNEYMEKVILDEGAQNKLVDSSYFREKLWALHQGLDYKQVMNIWVLTHLDFENRDFKPLRLDYQQFQNLVRHPHELENLLHYFG